MLNEFIDKILVHERDRKGCRETMQEVEIYFNFVGKSMYSQSLLQRSWKNSISERNAEKGFTRTT